MSEDAEDKPKRKYTRRVNSLVDDVIQEAAAEIAEENGIEDYDIDVGGIQVERIESDEPQPLKFIGAEPTSDTEKAKRVKLFGTNDSMKFTPWKGIDMWSCTLCGWSSFEKIKARRHCCD